MLTNRWMAGMSTAVIFGVLSSVANAHEPGPPPLVAMAAKLERDARKFEHEVKEHYHCGVCFDLLYKTSRDMTCLAGEIREEAEAGCLDHLDRYVEKMDRLYLYIDDLVGDIEKAAHCGKGRIDGDTRHVHGIMKSIHDTTHDLEAGVEIELRRSTRDDVMIGRGERPSRGRPENGRSGAEIAFGRGGIRFNFGR